MDKDRLTRLAKNPNLIEGIHNYCDRWCERCMFTAKCLNYAIHQEDAAERGINVGMLYDAFDERRDEILDVLVPLERLRKKTERHFPEARCFVRPGLDETGRSNE